MTAKCAIWLVSGLALGTSAAATVLQAPTEGTTKAAGAPPRSELGPAVAGRFMRARHVLTRESDDREQVRQYWTIAGSPEWLAVQYEYTRKAATP